MVAGRLIVRSFGSSLLHLRCLGIAENKGASDVDGDAISDGSGLGFVTSEPGAVESRGSDGGRIVEDGDGASGFSTGGHGCSLLGSEVFLGVVPLRSFRQQRRNGRR